MYCFSHYSKSILNYAFIINFTALYLLTNSIVETMPYIAYNLFYFLLTMYSFPSFPVRPICGAYKCYRHPPCRSLPHWTRIYKAARRKWYPFLTGHTKMACAQFKRELQKIQEGCLRHILTDTASSQERWSYWHIGEVFELRGSYVPSTITGVSKFIKYKWIIYKLYHKF